MMDTRLHFIAQCVRHGVNNNDLGYMIRLYFESSEESFFNTIRQSIQSKFFDSGYSNNQIAKLMDEYDQYMVNIQENKDNGA